jgi:hypothetical protein
MGPVSQQVTIDKMWNLTADLVCGHSEERRFPPTLPNGCAARGIVVPWSQLVCVGLMQQA